MCILFCLFADDTGIFPKDSFFNYVENSKEDGSDLNMRLGLLFDVLNKDQNVRSKQESLLQRQGLFQFPYVNGGLFAQTLSFPVFNDKRRELGAHYTSEENILKLINSLFMDELRAEFERVKSNAGQLDRFHQKISELKFLDPACGCGNFLNGYMIDAPNVYISIRSKPICNVPQMKNGNVPLDGDALKIKSENINKFKGFNYIKRLIGDRELLYNEKRYVLWLVGVSPSEIVSNKEVMKRVELCRQNRLSMKDKETQKLAERPTTFRDTNNPDYYIALLMVSSEKRKYLPMCYFNKDVIPTNQVQIISDATLYHFGILTSSVHNAWMRAVAGRLKSDYRYSKDIVYNNFPWPQKVEEKQQEKIKELAQKVLDARSLYPSSSLADLYDPLMMPSELLNAHKNLDNAVLKLYGLSTKNTEAEIVAVLFEKYQKLVKT